MAKAQSPLLGYNTNVRHKGKVFHIQTEDSGILKPHVMTHLFADGGRILKSQKSSYAHLLETDDLATQVKKLMQDQHKAMFLALREGQFDEVAGVSVAPPAAEAPVPVDAAEVPEMLAPSVPPTAVARPSVPPAAVARPSVPPAAPTPLNPSSAVVVLPPPPPRSNLPPVLPVSVPPVMAARPATFGDAWISERSLDEVILAFLQQELEADRP